MEVCFGNLDCGFEELKKLTVNAFLNTNCKIKFPMFPDPPSVSIVILTHNNVAATMKCLLSVASQDFLTSAELIVFDDASSDQLMFALLARLVNVKVTYNKNKSFFFGKANNHVVKKFVSPSSEYLLFLNNDIELKPMFFNALYGDISLSPKTGVIGCKLISARTGQLQEAGSMVFNDGSCQGYGRGDDPSAPEYNYRRSVDYVSGACIMIRKKLFVVVDGFDDKTYQMYYEDTDLQLKVRHELNMDVVYQPQAEALHLEYASSSQSQATKMMVKTQTDFVKRWKKVLETKRYSPKRKMCSREIVTGLRVLIVDDKFRRWGSGFGRMMEIIHVISELGHTLTLYPFLDQKHCSVVNTYRNMGVEIQVNNSVSWPDKRRGMQGGLRFRVGLLKAFLQQRGDLYDVVVVSRPVTFRKAFPVIRQYLPTSIPVIYDAEGIWYARDEMLLKMMNRPIDSQPSVVASKHNELQIFRNASAIWFVSEQDAKVVIKDGKFRKKLDYNVVTSAFPIYNTTTTLESPTIGFLGAFHNATYYNGDAVLHFIDNIFPLVRKQITDASFHVCGSNPPRELYNKHNPDKGVFILGVCELAHFFGSVKVVVAPHKYACGIQDKVTRSLSYGVPVVLSKYAADALQLREIMDGVLIADKPDEFADAVVKILSDAPLYKKLHFGSYKLIKDRFSRQSLKQSISESFMNYRKQSCNLQKNDFVGVSVEEEKIYGHKLKAK